ncbi:MAG: proprotein convertase P-domain-containing protein [Saprospiraceae bacterium]|nr:proprotein convertase P-domain-containing protein [Saprospiraceae bacterium]
MPITPLRRFGAAKLPLSVLLLVGWAIFVIHPVQAQPEEGRGVVCYSPGNIAVSNIQTNEVTLSWLDQNGTNTWELEVRSGNQPFFGTPTHVAQSNPFLLANLNPATTYRVRIRAICNAGAEKSGWTFFPFTFTTASPNPSECGMYFTINDDNCPVENVFSIEVDNQAGTMLGEDIAVSSVDLIIRHTFLADLHIALVSPSGQQVKLFEEHGQSRDHLGNPADPTCTQLCRFSSTDCQALNPIEHASNFIGTFKPDEHLNGFNDGSDPAGIWQLRICDDAKADTGSLRYLRIQFANLNCPPPFDLLLGQLTPTTADLYWSFSGDCNQVVVEYCPPGFQPGSGLSAGQGTIVTQTCQGAGNLFLTGLAASTAYDVYIRSVCPGGASSANSCPLSFTTDCDISQPITLKETFDAMQPCGGNCICGIDYPLNSFWDNRQSGDDFDWLVRQGPATVELQTGPFADVSGSGNYLYLETLNTDCQKGAQAILQSGCLIVNDPPGESCHMSFYYHMWGQTMGSLHAEATRDGGVTWVPIWETSGNQGSQWHKIYLDLSAFSGDTIQLRLRGVSGPSRTSQMALDDLTFYGLIPLGQPDVVYYRDADGDGFGDPGTPFFTCSSVIPAGYSQNALDCNDMNLSIHPNGMEITCNQIDENCNGMNDDSQAPLPSIDNVLLCRGLSATLEVKSPPFGQIYWYDLPVGGNAIHVGSSFVTPPLSQTTTYYLADSSLLFPCASNRKAVQVSVTDQPNLIAGPMGGLCAGDTLDLKDLPVSDLSLSAASWTYHTGSPAGPNNQLFNTRISPLVSTTYFILAQTDFGCRDELAIPIQVWSKPNVNIVNPDPLSLCAGESGLLQAQISGGGLGPFNFIWSTGFNQFYSPVIAGNIPGSQSYQVSVSDARGCQSSDGISVITLAGIPSLSIGSTDVTSCGGSNGSITVSPQAAGSYHYAWSGPVSGSALNQSGSFTIPGLKQGSYSLTLTHPGTGCTASPAPIVVNGPGPTVNSISIQSESCKDQQDGSILLNVSGLVSSYAWSHGPTTKDVFSLSPGNYQVTITGGGCSIVLQSLIVNAANPLVVGGQVQPAHCFGEQSGSVDLAVNGGVMPYTYLWNTGSQNQHLNGVGAGVYRVTITDQSGCSIRSDSFVVTQPLPLLATYNIQNVGCQGQQNGSIQLLVTGGTTPYHFLWSDNATSKDRSQLSPGTYAVSITDQKNCTFSIGNLSISEEAALSGSWTLAVPETCKGSADGQLGVQVVGGVQPYAYQWSFGTGQSTVTGLKAGTYQVTVTDQHGCSIVLGDTILPVSDPLLMEVVDLHDPTCDFLLDGSVSIAVTGGSGNYAYNWTSGGQTNPLVNLPSGNYAVTVSDLLGCTNSLSGLVLQQKSPLEVSLLGIQYAECGLTSSGDIDIAVTGHGPFMYKWQNGLMIQDPQNVPPGFYSVTVTDANQCQASLSGIAVSNNGQNYQVQLIQKDDPVCFGDQNGSITVQVFGGESPYQYNWSSGQEKDLNVPIDGVHGLGAGNYSVTLTDNRGCVLVYGPVSIEEPDPLDLTIPPSLIKNETCFGAKDGAITLYVNGGVTPYKTFWFRDSVSYSSVQSPKNLKPGNYTAIVVDKHGCSKTLSQQITILGPPSLFTYQNVSIQPDDCSSAETGSIDIKMKGGVQDYQYLWSDGSTEKFRNGLAPGTYCVTIQDQYKCIRDTCLVVPGGSTLVMIPTSVDECDPFSKIYTNTGGGTPPYSYLWSTGDTTLDLVNVPTGTYSVTITDKEGCSLIESGIDVGHPVLWIGDLFSIPADPGKSNGQAVVVPQGGTPPYSIQWDVNAMSQVTDTAYSLAPNTYCVQVTDQYNCVDTGCVKVEVMTSIDAADVTRRSVFSIIPNPARAYIVLDLPDGPHSPARWHLQLLDALGQAMTEWNDILVPIRLEVGQMTPGLYLLIGRDEGGRMATGRLVIH